MSANRSGTHLSKNVLQMKFMQRSVLRIEREQNEENLQKIIDDEHWVLNLPNYVTKESQYIKGQGYLYCEDLQFGRQSYKGCNPEIEKIMRLKLKSQQMKESEEKEKQESVSDGDMARRYSSLMNIIAKKFSKKRKRKEFDDDDDSQGDVTKAKKSFLKPSDE